MAMASNPQGKMEAMGVPFPEGIGGREEHPLLMEDILDNILGYLDIENLLRCRLINSLWNRVAGRLLSPKCRPINFVDDSGLLRCKGMKGIDDMGPFVNLLNTSWNFPCTKFNVHCGISTNPEEEQILTSFFRVVGPWATELKIVNSVQPQLFMEPKPLGIEYTCLKSLTYKSYDTYSNSINTDDSVSAILQSDLQFLGNILDHAPSLRCLHLQGLNGPEVVTAALALLDHVNCSQIWEFSLHGNIGDDHLNKIAEKGMIKLVKLYLQITGYSAVSSEGLQNFLEHQSETLETLHLETRFFKRQIIVKLPRFPKLKKLTVQGYYVEDPPTSWMSFSGVCYSLQFPVLKTLTIVENCCINLTEFVNNEILPTETVEELELPEDDEEKRANINDIVRNAARIFPKVRKLKAPCQNRVMLPVFKTFNSVEELALYDGLVEFQSADSVLTQFTERDCNRIKANPQRRRWIKLIEDTSPLPFLKRLKVLKIIQWCNDEDDKRGFGFSDLSCRAILLKLDALKCLKLVGHFSDKLTKPVIREMKEKFRVDFEKDDE